MNYLNKKALKIIRIDENTHVFFVEFNNLNFDKSRLRPANVNMTYSFIANII